MRKLRIQSLFLIGLFMVTVIIVGPPFVSTALALTVIEGDCFMIKPKVYDWKKDYLNFDISNFGPPVAPPAGTPAQNNILWAIKQWISFGKTSTDTADIIVWWESPPGTWNNAVWDVPPGPPGGTVDGIVSSESPTQGGANANHGSPYVMAPKSAWKPEGEDIKEKSRSWHPDEKQMMIDKYKKCFFKRVHAFLTPPWPGATIDVEVLWDNAPRAQEELKKWGDGPLGLSFEGLTYQWRDKTDKTKKSRAKIMMANPAKVPWFYAADTNGDEWITNEDAQPPAGNQDFYSIVKHELGHVFSLEHGKKEHDPQYYYDPPQNLCYFANSNSSDEAPTESTPGGFYSRALTLYFSSNRPGGHGGYDIWAVHWDGTKWTNPENLGPDINSSANEKDPFRAIDGSLFFSSNRSGGYGGYDLYMVEEDPDSLTLLPPENLGTGVNSAYDELDPALPGDLSKLYFSSDRPGGYGMFDLWQSNWDNLSGTWGLVTNLGSPINTTYNETGPSINMQGTLYFSSDRPGGEGGYDIWRYKVGLVACENVSELNSSADELDPRKTSNDDHFYFSSNRPGGHGGFDLYESVWITPSYIPRPSCLAPPTNCVGGFWIPVNKFGLLAP